MTDTPILVTGAAGFIGFHTIKKILSGQGTSHGAPTVVGIDNFSTYYDVRLKKDRLSQIGDHKGFVFHQADVADKDAMTQLWHRYGFKKVIHLAAQAGVRYSLVNPYEYITTNIMGTLILLELAAQQKGFDHFVYASSSSVYGKSPSLPFSEDDSLNTPISLYAATKHADELMAHAYTDLYKFPTTGLRFFTVYGPWGRPDQAAFLFADKMRAGEAIQIFNDGNMQRDFTYIDDVVDGTLAALNRPNLEGEPYSIYNLGNSQPVQLMDFITQLEHYMGMTAVKDFHPMQKGDVKATLADIEKANKDFGYSPTTPTSVGLKNFVDWYKAYHGLTTEDKMPAKAGK